MPSSTCHRNPPQPLVQKAWTISKTPAKIDTQPMKMVLTTVTSMTSPRIRNPARIITSPSRMQIQNGGEGRLPTPTRELLSYVVMSFSSLQALRHQGGESSPPAAYATAAVQPRLAFHA